MNDLPFEPCLDISKFSRAFHIQQKNGASLEKLLNTGIITPYSVLAVVARVFDLSLHTDCLATRAEHGDGFLVYAPSSYNDALKTAIVREGNKISVYRSSYEVDCMEFYSSIDLDDKVLMLSRTASYDIHRGAAIGFYRYPYASVYSCGLIATEPSVLEDWRFIKIKLTNYNVEIPVLNACNQVIKFNRDMSKVDSHSHDCKIDIYDFSKNNAIEETKKLFEKQLTKSLNRAISICKLTEIDKLPLPKHGGLSSTYATKAILEDDTIEFIHQVCGADKYVKNFLLHETGTRSTTRAHIAEIKNHLAHYVQSLDFLHDAGILQKECMSIVELANKYN
jgi:hypothetical protein